MQVDAVLCGLQSHGPAAGGSISNLVQGSDVLHPGLLNLEACKLSAYANDVLATIRA